MIALLLLLELWNIKSSILCHYIFDFVTPLVCSNYRFWTSAQTSKDQLSVSAEKDPYSIDKMSHLSVAVLNQWLLLISRVRQVTCELTSSSLRQVRLEFSLFSKQLGLSQVLAARVKIYTKKHMHLHFDCSFQSFT